MDESAVSGAPESGALESGARESGPYELIPMGRIDVEPQPPIGEHSVADGAASLECSSAMNNGTRTAPAEATPLELPAREAAFSEVADFAHAPPRARVQIASGVGGRFALAGAKCERRLPARYGPAPEVLVRPASERIRPRARISLA